jgi:hypothetical protein
MARKLTVTIGGLLAAAGLVLGPSAASASTVHAAPALPKLAATSSFICVSNGSGYCLNRNMGGTATGIPVILWARDADSNEIAVYTVYSGMCNNGRVSANLECPFTPGSGFNTRYNGDYIVAVNFLRTNGTSIACMAGTGYSALGACGSDTGSGAAYGAINVLSPSNYLVNRYWTNTYGRLAWWCSGGYNTQLEFSYAGTAGVCQFNYAS